MLLQVISYADIVVRMFGRAELGNKVDISILFNCDFVQFLNVLVIQKALLVMVSKRNFLHKEFNRVFWLEFLNLFNCKAFSKVFDRKFVGGKQDFYLGRGDFVEESQQLLMVFIHQMVDVVERKQESLA